MPKPHMKLSAALFLALAGILLVLFPDERVVFPVLLALMYEVGRSAAAWMAGHIPRWIRLLMAVATAGAASVALAFAPLGADESLARILARSAGAAGLVGLTWHAALWELLPGRQRKQPQGR